MTTSRRAPVAVALMLVAVSAFLVNGCAARTVRHDTVRFVKEAEATSVRPLITVVRAPTASDATLQLRLSRKVVGPVYEMDVTEQQARMLELQNVFVIAVGAITGGGVSLHTTEGTTVVRGEPRKLGSTAEVEHAWAGGRVAIDVGGGVRHEAVADRDGAVRVLVPALLRSLPSPPTGPIRLTISSAIGAERDVKVVDVPVDALGR